MRGSPFPSLKVTLRVLAKALVLLLILNFACIAAGFNPIATLLKVNTWGLVGHGRARLAYPSDFQNGQLPAESLVAAHSLAYTPKADDEFRVVVLGESGIAGWGLHDNDTFTAQLTARSLKIGGKRIVAYNLAYPSPSAPRDVLILDAALHYQPDLVIWFLTPAALDDAPAAIGTNSTLFELNRARLQSITTRFGLQNWFTTHLDPEPDWHSWFAIQNQDALPVWLNSLLYPFQTPSLGITDRHMGSEPIPAIARYTVGREGFTVIPNDTWRFLDVGKTLAQEAGARLLVINEPMLIGHGENIDVNYNVEYERAFYDNIRQKLTDYALAHGFWFGDLWDAIPAAAFTDTPLHADASGYAVLVDRVAAIFKDLL